MVVCWFVENGKSRSLINSFYYEMIHLCSPQRKSTVSVVLDFNASLNNVAPVSPIQFPVDSMKGEKSFYGRLLCVFCIYLSDWVLWVLYLIVMHHSMMLLLCLQSCSLLIWREWRRDDCLWMPFVYRFMIFTTQIELGECCVWFQCVNQWCCSCFSNPVVCWFYENEKRKDCCWMLFVLFILCPPLTSSPVSVVFDFNAPLNDFAPVYPIQLSVVW